MLHSFVMVRKNDERIMFSAVRHRHISQKEAIYIQYIQT